MSISPSRSISDPEKRPAEPMPMESEREQKRLKFISGMSKCFNSEGLHSADVRLRVISDIEDYLRSEDLDPSEIPLTGVSIMSNMLRSNGLDPNIATEDWNQFCKMKSTSSLDCVAEDADKSTSTNNARTPPIAITLEEEYPEVDEQLIKQFRKQLIEEFDDFDGDEIYISAYSEPENPLPVVKTWSPRYCRYCKNVAEHKPMFCPDFKNPLPPSPPPTPQPTAQQIRRSKCPICCQPIHLGTPCYK